MKVSKLVQLGEPFLLVTTLVDSDLEDLRLQLVSSCPQSVIRILRGAKSITLDDFFDEVSAALQFPYYFGENWAAVDECITDLGWLPGDGYLLIIRQANLLLRDAPGDFPTLMRLLSNACAQWLTPNQYIPRDLQPTPFRIVFQCAEVDLSQFLERLEQTGIKPALGDLSKFLED